MGTFRFILSVLVVNGHLGTIAWPAAFSVFSFYVISGYLMTLIMNTRYGYSWRGFLSYLVNRLLRIYPTYYIAVLLSLCVILLVPYEIISSFNEAIRVPESILDWLKNTFLLGLGSKDSVRIVPPAWALYNEIFYYIAIGIFLGKSRKIAFIWLAISIVYIPTLCFFRTDLCSFFYHRYATVLAASLPFSIGCCLFHCSDYLFRFLARFNSLKILYCAVFLYGLNYAAAHYLPSFFRIFFYINLSTTAFLILSLFHHSKVADHKHSLFSKLDGRLGDLSYPIYLFHWQSAILTGYIIGFPNKSFNSFYFGLIASITLGLIEIRLLSGKINLLRKRVKNALPKHI